MTLFILGHHFLQHRNILSALATVSPCNHCLYWIGLDKLKDNLTWRWLDGQEAVREDIDWVQSAPLARKYGTEYGCGYVIAGLNSTRYKYMKTDNWISCYHTSNQAVYDSSEDMELIYSLCEVEDGTFS